MARAAHARRARVEDDLTLREQVEEIGAQIVRLGERSIGEGQEKLTEEINRLKGGVDELLDRLGEQGRVTMDTVIGTVQRRPVASVAGAFAAGMLLSLLLSRK
jgi:ElaB/YqjD/DUF883 family membrane-anchored ribosome-binding protein